MLRSRMLWLHTLQKAQVFQVVAQTLSAVTFDKSSLATTPAYTTLHSSASYTGAACYFPTSSQATYSCRPHLSGLATTPHLLPAHCHVVI